MNIAVLLIKKNIANVKKIVKTFQNNSLVDAIVLTAPINTQEVLEELMDQEKISKYAEFAPYAPTHQLSVYSGLTMAKEVSAWYEVPDEIGGYIHVGVKEDAEETNHYVILYSVSGEQLPPEQITRCVEKAHHADGAYIRLSPKQLIEVYKLDRLLSIYDGMPDEQLDQTPDSVEIAEEHGMGMVD